jgi:hypothetical protein
MICLLFVDGSLCGDLYYYMNGCLLLGIFILNVIVCSCQMLYRTASYEFYPWKIFVESVVYELYMYLLATKEFSMRVHDHFYRWSMQRFSFWLRLGGYVVTIDNIVPHLWSCDCGMCSCDCGHDAIVKTSKAFTLWLQLRLWEIQRGLKFVVPCLLSNTSLALVGWFMAAYFKVVFCTFYLWHGVCQFSHSLLTMRDKMISEMWVSWLFVDLIGLFFEIV